MYPFHFPTSSNKPSNLSSLVNRSHYKRVSDKPNDENASGVNAKRCLVDRYISWADGEPLALMKGWIKWARIKARYYQNPPLQPRGRTAGFWGAIVGPNNIFGPAPSIRWGPKAQAEEGYGPDTVIQVQNSIGIQPRTIQSLASPKSPRKKG